MWHGRPSRAEHHERAAVDQVIDRIRSGDHAVLSLDVFDTLLLRDGSTETQRFSEASHVASQHLGVSGEALTRMRWMSHDNAYRALHIGSPTSEVKLTQIATTSVVAMGLPTESADIFASCEVAMDVNHLRPNDELLEVIAQARNAGTRVIATSDTYYSAEDIGTLFDAVVGYVPVDRIYASSDMSATKHRGHLFPAVADEEATPAAQILHIGDSWHSDVEMATRAGWQAMHLPLSAAAARARTLGRIRYARQTWIRRR